MLPTEAVIFVIVSPTAYPAPEALIDTPLIDPVGVADALPLKVLKFTLPFLIKGCLLPLAATTKFPNVSNDHCSASLMPSSQDVPPVLASQAGVALMSVQVVAFAFSNKVKDVGVTVSTD